MGENSSIQWTHHTFNPWRGCEKISPGCANCYAEAMSGRNPAVLGKWGRAGTRAFASDSYWRKPLAWDRAAKLAGERRRVFCASLADVFEDRDELRGHRWRLFKMIEDTPNLDWLLLTKRPELVRREIVAYERFLDGFTNLSDRVERLGWVNAWLDGMPPANVWLGTSVEDRNWAERRIPELAKLTASVRFLSMEPLLEAVDLSPWLGLKPPLEYSGRGRCLGTSLLPDPVAVDWVIVGGESGAKARPFEARWARSLAIQCDEASVPCFVKQMGARPIGYDGEPWKLDDSHGGDWDEWPADLRVREFPAPLVVA